MWKEWLGMEGENADSTVYDSLEMKYPAMYQASKAWRERHGKTFEEYIKQFAPELAEKEPERENRYNRASYFDPVLVEILCRWFTPGEGSSVFDNLAGGITEGAIACKCGHKFVGIELRPEQVESNLKTVTTLNVKPEYVQDDGTNAVQHLGIGTQDLLLSCPPYFNLKTYSNLEDDLSTKSEYPAFIGKLEEVFAASIKCLKRNRFAAILVGDVRDKDGSCCNFPGDVISIFQRNGCVLWNDIVVITNDATAKLRARQYLTNRKVARLHQRLLVFYYGRPTAIQKNFPKLSSLTSNTPI